LGAHGSLLEFCRHLFVGADRRCRSMPDAALRLIVKDCG